MKRARRAISTALTAKRPTAGRRTPAGSWVRTQEGDLAFQPNPRHRVWCCQALLDILEEPARLTPENPGG